jgi:hypothetical protein
MTRWFPFRAGKFCLPGSLGESGRSRIETAEARPETKTAQAPTKRRELGNVSLELRRPSLNPEGKVECPRFRFDWHWISGERSSFTSWEKGPPAAGKEPNFAILVTGTGKWQAKTSPAQIFPGIIEVDAKPPTPTLPQKE